MNRKVLCAVLAAPALALVYVALSWGAGALTRAQLSDWDKSLELHVPLIKVAHRQSSGGIFSSSVEITYELNTALFPAAMRGAAAAATTTSTTVPAAPPAESGPLRFTVHHAIQHGPLPGWQSIGSAKIDSQLVFSDAVRAQLKESLGTDQPLHVTTTLGFFGGGVSTLNVPAFTYRNTSPGNALNKFEWLGLTARSTFTRDLNRMSGELNLLGLRGTDGKGQDFAVGHLGYSYDLKREFDVLYAGTVALTLDALSGTRAGAGASAGAGAPLRMQDLKLVGLTTVSGEYVDTTFTFGIASLAAATTELRDLHYDLSIRHLHGPTYAALTDKMRSAYFATVNNASAPTPAASGAAILEPFKEYGPALLEHKPEIIIDRIAFKTPQGGALVTGKFSLPGFVAADMDRPMSAWITKLEAIADFTVDESLLAKPVAAPAAASPPNALQGIRDKVASLEQQGFVTRQGTQLRSHIEFRQGALTVNGKPLGPPAARGSR